MNHFLENIFQAITAVKQNRIRTIMSIVGVAAGVAAVMAVSAVSQSGKDYIYGELSTYGLNSLWVYRQWEDESPFASVRQGSGIDSDDLHLLENSACCPDVLRVSPLVYEQDWLKTIRVGNIFTKSSVSGVGLEHANINSDELLLGRWFRNDDIKRRKNVAVIGPKTRIELFGENVNVIGSTIRLGEHKLTIIGVLKEKNRDFLTAIGATQGNDENRRVLVPYTFYQQLMGSKDIHTLRAEARDQEAVDRALNQIVMTLNRSQNHKYVYQSESMKQWIATANSILESVSIIGIVSAMVSLLVGGIGIFNIMSSSVMERTREIGLRKAIGASEKDIMQQFLLESVYISVIGGVVGILLCFIVFLGLNTFWDFSFSLPWLSFIVPVLVTILVGLLAGFIPARHASRLMPATALRHE